MLRYQKLPVFSKSVTKTTQIEHLHHSNKKIDGWTRCQADVAVLRDTFWFSFDLWDLFVNLLLYEFPFSPSVVHVAGLRVTTTMPSATGFFDPANPSSPRHTPWRVSPSWCASPTTLGRERRPQEGLPRHGLDRALPYSPTPTSSIFDLGKEFHDWQWSQRRAPLRAQQHSRPRRAQCRR